MAGFDNRYGDKIANEFNNVALNTKKPYSNDPNYGRDNYGGSERTQALTAQLDNLQNGGYDYTKDPQYQAYRKQYLREGQRAMQDTMAQAAAMTGGRPSSYALGAGQQAFNNYAAMSADKVPELFQQQYERTHQQLQDSQWQDQQNFNIYDTNRKFGEEQRQNRIQNMQTQQQQEWNMFMDKANAALNIGDYNTLAAMGFDTSRANFGNELAIAQLIAQVTGNVGALQELLKKGGGGIVNWSSYFGSSGGGSGASSGGGGSQPYRKAADSPAPKENPVDIDAVRNRHEGYSTTINYGSGRSSSNGSGRSGRLS